MRKKYKGLEKQEGDLRAFYRKGKLILAAGTVMELCDGLTSCLSCASYRVSTETSSTFCKLEQSNSGTDKAMDSDEKKTSKFGVIFFKEIEAFCM